MVPVHRPEMPQPWRVSMTLPVLNAARHVMMVVGGSAKAPMVRRAIDGDPSIPAGRVSPTDGTMTWILTEDAAAELEPPAA
jgi:6-phosphogluconolactonase